MLTTNGRNQLLDATDVAFLSLHTDFPGQNQANEITGGSPAYARKAVTFASAASGSKASSDSQAFDVSASSTVRWIGYSDAVTAGNGRGASPNGAVPKEFIVDASADTINMPAQPYADTNKIVFYGGTPPGGITEGVIYFVRDSATDSFKVAATSGGSAIDLTSQADPGVVCSKIVEETFGSQGTFTLATGAAVIALNN